MVIWGGRMEPGNSVKFKALYQNDFLRKPNINVWITSTFGCVCRGFNFRSDHRRQPSVTEGRTVNKSTAAGYC